MTSVQDAPVQRRRLRGELRRAREALGHTQKDVADAMDWSLSKLMRIESGSVRISTTDLKALLQYYGISDTTEVNRLVSMARASRDRRAWWTSYGPATSQTYLNFLAFENSASAIVQFQPILLPGLLQVEEYARAVLQAVAGPASERRVEEWVELRMRRQEELFERPKPPQMLFVMDEAALYREVGGRAVMRRQLLHLKEVATTRENVTIEIVPFTAGAHPGMKGPFVILEFPGDVDEDVLYLENSRGDMIFRDEQQEVAPAREALGRLLDLAGKEDAVVLVDKALDHMK